MIELPKFRTNRLILKQVSLVDIPSYTRCFVDYDVIKFLSGVPWPYPENGVEDHLKNEIFPHQGKSKWTWGIFLRSKEDELIGCVELWKEGRPEHRGFWLGKKYWRKGIMTEAMYPMIDFAFKTFPLKKLIFANAVGNIASRKVKEKTGCKFIGISPAQFVGANFKEQELWELSEESWEQHKLSCPNKYSVLK